MPRFLLLTRLFRLPRINEVLVRRDGRSMAGRFGVLVQLVFGVTVAMAQAPEPDDPTKFAFELPASAAEPALKRFSEQSGRQVLFPTDIVKGVRTTAVKGELTAREALNRMLAGTPLRAVLNEKTGAWAILRGAAADPNGQRAAGPPASGRSPDSLKKNETNAPQNQERMKRNKLLTRMTAIITLLVGSPVIVQGSAAHTGIIEGRVTNPATATVVERARVTVEGAPREAFTDADGYYRLPGVPAGTAQVRASFTGFPSATARIVVAAGQSVQQDFELGPLASAAVAAQDGAPIQLGEYVVAAAREMSAAALAINEQRFAPNVKTVVATDEFGDIAEGNVGEFLKFLPGVNMDATGGNARHISLQGVPADYVPVTLDGFSLASAVGPDGSGGTDRSVGLDQVSINNLSRIEVSFSPTPDSEGSALAGSVNMVPRSSFERTKPEFTFSTYVMMRDNAKDWKKTPGPFHPTRKIHPGADFSYINPVSRRFGFTLSAGFNRQYSGDGFIQNVWRGANTTTNGNAYPHTSPDQPYLSAVSVRDAAKDTKRSSFGATVDYKLTRDDRLSFSFTYSTFNVLFNQPTLTFDVGRVAPGDFTTTSTRGAAGQGFTQLVVNSADRTNWTYMPSLIWRHDGPVWKMGAGFAYSRASNRQRTHDSGFFGGATSRRTGLTVSFDDIFYLRPNTITVTDAAGNPVDPYSLDDYNVTRATSGTRATDDTKRTAYANVRRDFFGRVPLSLRAGLDFRQSQRDRRFFSWIYTFGPNYTAQPFIDPSFSSRGFPYGYPTVESISTKLLWENYAADPTNVTVNANTSYRNVVSNSKYTGEIVTFAAICNSSKTGSRLSRAFAPSRPISTPKARSPISRATYSATPRATPSSAPTAARSPSNRRARSPSRSSRSSSAPRGPGRNT